MSAAVLDEVRRVLGREAAPDAVTVSYPTRPLEEYFLGVVRRAHEQRQETSGAQTSGGIAEYLRRPAQAGDGRDAH